MFAFEQRNNLCISYWRINMSAFLNRVDEHVSIANNGYRGFTKRSQVNWLVDMGAEWMLIKKK